MPSLIKAKPFNALWTTNKKVFSPQCLQMDTGVYIVHFDHSPSPFFEIHLFPPTNKFPAGGAFFPVFYVIFLNFSFSLFIFPLFFFYIFFSLSATPDHSILHNIYPWLDRLVIKIRNSKSNLILTTNE